MSRRPVIRYSSLTSLLDVLFILIFASMAQAAQFVEQAQKAARQQGAQAPAQPTAAKRDTPAQPEPSRRDAGITAPAASLQQLRQQASRALLRSLEQRPVVIVRISAAGQLTAIEYEQPSETRSLQLAVPLLERVPDPRVALAYLGDRSRDLRICSIVAHHLQRADLSQRWVIIAPDAPLAELTVALARGLRRDEERCLRDQLGLAVLIDSPTLERISP